MEMIWEDAMEKSLPLESRLKRKRKESRQAMVDLEKVNGHNLMAEQEPPANESISERPRYF